MFDSFLGLPLHPLVVHGAVVLLPLAALGVIALVLRSAWRERFAVAVRPAAAHRSRGRWRRLGRP